MTLDAFFARIAEDNRRKPGTHRLESPISDRELLLWEKAHPGRTVPEELLLLLRRSNGLRIRMNPDSPGGADCCFTALKDIRGAGRFMYGDDSEAGLVPASWFALAQDADGTTVLIVDMTTEEFLSVDPVDSDNPKTLSKSVDGALGWLADFFPVFPPEGS